MVSEYVTIVWEGGSSEEFAKKTGEFRKMWLFEKLLEKSDDFKIGEPKLIFQNDVRDAIFNEVIGIRPRYRINRESLERLTRNIKKILDERFKCCTKVSIPLLETDDPNEWRKAKETGNAGMMNITTEMIIDKELKKITIM